MILDCDLSQIEWRIAAFLSQDAVMCQEIRDGVDQHAATCTSPNMMALPFSKENRTLAKIFNFRAIYADLSSAAYAYYMDPRMPDFSQKKWEAIMEGFAAKYSGLVDAHEQWVREVRKTGMLTGPFGHTWKFQKELKKGGYYDYSKPKIYNYPVQGSSGAVIKLALIVIGKRIKHLKQSKFVMTVHDSLIWDTPEKEAYELAKINIEVFREIPDLAKKYFGININVPIDGEAALGQSWGTVKEIII